MKFTDGARMSDAWKYRPAEDHGLSAEDRFKSVRREPGLLSWLGHHAATSVLRTYLALWHRMRVEGRERLPRKAPFVVIANHSSHLDALVLAAALPHSARSVAYPVAAGDAFFTSTPMAVFSSVFINAVPLWRKKVTARALTELRERLLIGDSGFILFPEGARTRDGAPLPFKAGLGMLVAGTPVPVVPCYLDGAFEACPPGATIPRPRKLVVRVGEALSFADMTDDRAGWEHVAATAKEAVFSLAGGLATSGHPGGSARASPGSSTEESPASSAPS